MDHVADHLDLRIEQANAAIRDLIQSLPDGRITTTSRPEYERLVAVWAAAVEDGDDDDDPAPRPLAA